jgi:hypothetical protein
VITSPLTLVWALAQALLGVVAVLVGTAATVRAVHRLRAAEVLGALAVPDGVPDLLRRLDDRNHDVRRAAVRALGRIGAPEAVPGCCTWRTPRTAASARTA